MRRLVVGLALLSSIAAFLVIAGGGLFLLAVESSGERGSGALLALSGTIAFAAAMALVFAGSGAFAGAAGRAVVVIAALLGMLPVATLSAGLLRFSGFPLGSPVPLFDWAVFALGVVLGLGALSVLVLGYWRLRERGAIRRRADEPPPAAYREVEPQAAAPEHPARLQASHLNGAQEEEAGRDWTVPLRPAGWRERQANAGEEVRVTPVAPVELPSIGQFRRR